jgi:hypothetical protein
MDGGVSVNLHIQQDNSQLLTADTRNAWHASIPACGSALFPADAMIRAQTSSEGE